MVQALSWAALGTGFTFLMTTMGAAVVFFFAEEPRPQFQRAMLGFAAGVMTAASVWSLLLPAIEQAADFGVPGWLPAAAGLLLGVCFLSALDAALPHLRRQRDADLTHRQHAAAHPDGSSRRRQRHQQQIELSVSVLSLRHLRHRLSPWGAARRRQAR